MVGLQPDIIVTDSTPTTAALQRETRTIPIVFWGVVDPVASSLVASLNQPGGNITGFATYETPFGGKWLELLLEVAPGLKRAAIMLNYSITSSARPSPSPAASSRGSTARAGTSPASLPKKPRWEASGLSCSRRSHPDSSGSP